MITKSQKLTIKEQKRILSYLFKFSYEKIINCIGEEQLILFDEEGWEFYESSENSQFNFSTLAGIFSYIAYRAKKEGYADCQKAMKKAIGIFS